MFQVAVPSSDSPVYRIRLFSQFFVSYTEEIVYIILYILHSNALENLIIPLLGKKTCVYSVYSRVLTTRVELTSFYYFFFFYSHLFLKDPRATIY